VIDELQGTVEPALHSPMDAMPAESTAGLSQVCTPAGLWLHSAGATAGGVPGGRGISGFDELVFGEAPSESRFSLLLGAPGEPLPSISSVAAVVRSLEPAILDQLIVNVYGPEPEADRSVAQALADVLNLPTRTYHGLLVADPDGVPQRTAIDAAGRPSWQPFAQVSSYRPGEIGPTVDRWQAPFSDAKLIGLARYWLTPDWAVDVVPAGLVVRPTTAPPNPLLRCAPTHPDRVDLVVDCPGAEALPDGMLTALGWFGDCLPPPIRTRLRLVLTAGIDRVSARRLGWAVPAPQVAWSVPVAQAQAVRVEPMIEVEPEVEPEPEPEQEPMISLPPPRLATALVVTTEGRVRLH
jgi:hypothetical protein